MAKAIIKNSLIGVGIGIAAALILTLLFGLIAVKAEDPDSIVALLSHAARFLGAAICGFSASKLNGEKGLAVGGISGAVYAVTIMLVSAFTSGEINFLYSFICLVISFLISLIFGLLGRPREKSGNARRKALMKRSGF